MKFTLTIDSDNEALAHPNELPRILRKVANYIEGGSMPERVRDITGNTVGSIDFENERILAE